MGMLGTVVAYPEEVYPLVKLKLAADRIRRQIPAEPHWAFSYSMLQKVSRSFALVIQQLGPQLRNAVSREVVLSVIYKPACDVGLITLLKDVRMRNRWDHSSIEVMTWDILWSSAQDIMKGSELAQDYEANIVLSKDCLFGYWTCFGNQSDQYVSICSGIQTHGISVCVFYLVLRALDTVEDDTSIPSDIKVPILQNFYRHIYDREWHFSCGTKDYKVLMDKLHLVSTAFLELERSYQEAIEDITKRMGAGMAKFICKEVETTDDYDEYCHYVAGLVGLGLSKLFHASGSEELAPDNLSNSMGLFLQNVTSSEMQKTNIIRDYLEDINEIPKSRMFWPHQIWSKYASKLEDFKYVENSTKAVQCLNDLVTNALIHAEDCLQYMSALKDLSIFRFAAIPQIMAIGTLALCYNNVEVFRGVVKMRRGLTAKVIDQTYSMSDVYGAFYEFSSLLKSKIDNNDPNASLTHKRVDAIQKTCISSGLLSKRSLHVYESKFHYVTLLIMVVFLLVAMLIPFGLHK
ncbi:hypothetical protein C4D60_Mb04t18550 [Musa balbisiana]|uniref:Squalene synthase n=1 Tax=Musa balbisiana TaxID=52838 RepID=A0A4S8KCY9_MUSBA|nr:hypothetical protein C4D60_Mb04t18550 [Musa balbisiana]